MSSTTEIECKEKIDAMPSLEGQTEAPTSRIYADAYNKDTLRTDSLRPGDRSFNLPGLSKEFGLVEYNARGGNDFDYRRQGGNSYDFRPYLSNVYGCNCDGGCSCWDRSQNYFNNKGQKGYDQNQMVCGLDANGKYHGPQDWQQKLFNGRSQQNFNSSREYDPNHMICGLDSNGKYHGPQEWQQRLFSGQRSVCGPGGCYPMDQTRNYYNGRHSDQASGMDQSSKFYGDRRSLGPRYNFNQNDGNGNGSGNGSAGDCSGGSCSGGGGIGRNIASFLGRLFGRGRR
jgi:hypothetical protein